MLTGRHEVAERAQQIATHGLRLNGETNRVHQRGWRAEQPYSRLLNLTMEGSVKQAIRKRTELGG